MTETNTDKNIKTTKINSVDSFYSTVFTTFIAVFLAELGDKTQIATLLLTAETGHPIIIFLSAASALICSSLIGVLLGRFIANKVDNKLFNRGAAILMILISLVMFYNIIKPLELFTSYR